MRNELAAYAANVTTQLAANTPGVAEIELAVISLSELVQVDPQVTTLDRIVANFWKQTYCRNYLMSQSVGWQNGTTCGVQDISQVQEALKVFHDYVIPFASEWVGDQVMTTSQQRTSPLSIPASHFSI